MTVIAAALTAFYSWRLIFLTFHGSPHDRHHYEEARESPMVMLIPLGFLAVGSIFAGYPFKDCSSATGRRSSSATRSNSGRTIISSRTCITFRTWRASPDGDDGDRLRHRMGVLHPPAGAAGGARAPAGAALQVPAQQVVLRRALRLLWFAPRSGSAACCGNTATAG
jgi:hypothetical protein